MTELTRMTLSLDSDDARDINAAIAHYQATSRWERFADSDTQGVFLPEGESDIAGAILGEICRGWLESRGALKQGGDHE